jgi:uncharacterized coiled-coil protein SlyX
MGAKDIAFEKERAKYRRRIRELESVINDQAKTEISLRRQLQDSQTVIREKDEWIRRLLEYMDVSPEDLRAKMKADQSISTIAGIIGAMGGGIGWRR